MRFCSFCRALLVLPESLAKRTAGEVFVFCALRAGETFDQVSEMFPKFEKNKMRVVTQPWKVLQGLVQKTPVVLSSRRARDVRDAEERRSGGPEGTL